MLQLVKYTRNRMNNEMWKKILFSFFFLNFFAICPKNELNTKWMSKTTYLLLISLSCLCAFFNLNAITTTVFFVFLSSHKSLLAARNGKKAKKKLVCSTCIHNGICIGWICNFLNEFNHQIKKNPLSRYGFNAHNTLNSFLQVKRL